MELNISSLSLMTQLAMYGSTVFARFIEWKALAEKSTGRKLKVLRTDNGGEYILAEFEAYMKK